MNLTCVVIDDELHAISELADLIGSNSHLELKQTFMNVEAAIEFLTAEGNTDIIFCDINMPRMGGLEAAKLLHPFCRFLVFATAFREHALTAFQENAAGYLVKPVDEQSFLRLIKSFISKDQVLLSTSLIQQQGVFFIKGDRKNQLIKVEINKILSIQAHLNYSMIHLENGASLLTYLILHQFEVRLRPSKLFFRVNKSYIISMVYFKEINGNKVYLTTGESFVIGDKYKAALFSFVKKRSLNF